MMDWFFLQFTAIIHFTYVYDSTVGVILARSLGSARWKIMRIIHSLHFGNHSLKDEVSCFTSVSPKWSQESWVHVAKTSLDKLDFFVFISYESSWNCICYIIGSFLMQWCSRGNLHGGAKCESIIVHCHMIKEWCDKFLKQQALDRWWLWWLVVRSLCVNCSWLTLRRCTCSCWSSFFSKTLVNLAAMKPRHHYYCTSILSWSEVCASK